MSGRAFTQRIGCIAEAGFPGRADSRCRTAGPPFPQRGTRADRPRRRRDGPAPATDLPGSTVAFRAGKPNASAAAGVSELLAHVTGPQCIFRKGFYTWTASRSRGIEGYSYRWRQRYVGGSWSIVGSNSASVSLMVYGSDSDFDLELRVISGAQTKYDTLRVVNCIHGGEDCTPY
jgi:hypothetical protein